MNKPSIVRRHSEATARTYILLPVSPLWVYSTIAVAYVLNISRLSGASARSGSRVCCCRFFSAC